VQFDEPVSSASAENIANYQLDKGLTATTADLQDDTTTLVLTTTAMVDGTVYTLTVNGISDRASTPNTIASDVQANFTFVGTSNSGMKPPEYVWDVINDGVDVYTDRGYTYTDVPTPYIGMTYLRTINDHKNESGSGFVQFTLDADSRLYIGYDSRNTPIPAWLESWTNIGDRLEATHTTLDLYSKDFRAGPVSLDGNALGNSMYVVLMGPVNAGGGSGGGDGTSGGGTGGGGSSGGSSGSGGGNDSGGGGGDGNDASDETSPEDVVAGATGPLGIALMLLLIYGLRLRRLFTECRPSFGRL
jgi:hypothetical protein